MKKLWITFLGFLCDKLNWHLRYSRHELNYKRTIDNNTESIVSTEIKECAICWKVTVRDSESRNTTDEYTTLQAAQDAAPGIFSVPEAALR